MADQLHIVEYLQQRMILRPGDKQAIVSNRAMIKAVRDTIEANLKVVKSLEAANHALCAHENAVSYSDPRDSGWDCPDCGASR